MKASNLQTLPLQDPPGALTRSDVLPGNHPRRERDLPIFSTREKKKDEDRLGFECGCTQASLAVLDEGLGTEYSDSDGSPGPGREDKRGADVTAALVAPGKIAQRFIEC